MMVSALSRFNLDGAATAGIRVLNCTGVNTGVFNYVKKLLPCNDFGFFEKLTLDALRNRIDSSYALNMYIS